MEGTNPSTDGIWNSECMEKQNTWKGKLHKSNAEQTVYRFQIIINS